MAKKKAMTRLEKLKAKLQTTNLGGGADYWKPKSGANTVRLLPGVGEMDEVFWVEIGTHYLEQGTNWTTWKCPQFTWDDPCPICEFVQMLRSSGDATDRELADDLKVSRAYAVNLIDRKEPEKGPQIYNAGVSIMRQWAAMIGDPDYGDLIIDNDQGLDITITRSGTGRQTNYDIKAKRRETPLSSDPAEADEWMSKAIDLTPVELTDDPEEDALSFKDESGNVIAAFGIKPYDRIKREFEAIGDEPEEEEELEEDDDEELEEDDDISDARAAISRRRASMRPKSSSNRAPRRRR